jgi:uncharacterized protein (DUF697 family)
MQDTEYAEGTDNPFSEVEEMQYAANLLDQFLGSLLNKAGQAVSGVLKSRVGRALGGYPKGAISQALPGIGAAVCGYFAPGAGAAVGRKLAASAGQMFGLELEGLHRPAELDRAADGVTHLAANHRAGLKRTEAI